MTQLYERSSLVGKLGYSHFISDSDPSPDAKPPPQTIIDLIDRYYPEFNDPSWTNWRVFLKALFHLDMSEAECDTFKRFTKRDTLPSKSFEEAWLVVGRRGGKSRIMSLIAVYLTMCRTYKLARGETGLFMILAKDKRQARVVKRYTEALLLAVPAFCETD